MSVLFETVGVCHLRWLSVKEKRRRCYIPAPDEIIFALQASVSSHVTTSRASTGHESFIRVRFIRKMNVVELSSHELLK